MEGLIFPLLLVLLALPLFLSSRRQRRMYHEAEQLQKSLHVGDEVMTSSGLYGTIAELEETTIDLEVSPGVYTTWSRQAIKEKVVHEEDAGPADDETGDADERADATEDSTGKTERTDTVDNGQPTTESRG